MQLTLYTGCIPKTSKLASALRLFVALILAASVGCSFIPPYTAAADFRAADFFPSDTWLFSDVTLRPSLGQLAGATRLASAFTSQPGWDAYVQRLMSPASGASTDVISDTLALLDGEVAIGAFGTLSGSNPMPQLVLLAHSSNPDQAIGKLGSAEGVRQTPPTKDAHGANVYALPGQVALATFQGWIVGASSQSVLQATLDRIAGRSTSAALSSEPRFKSIISRLPAERLALEYVDFGAVLRAVQPVLPRNEPGLPPETQALLGSIDSQVGLSFAAAASGLELRIESATRLPPELMRDAVGADLGDPADAFAHLPADTLVAFGTGLPPLVPEVDSALGVALQRAADRLGLPELADTELHLSDWLVGPVAVGGSAGDIGEPGGLPNLFLVAQVSDPAAARDDIASIAALLPPKTVTPVSIAGSQFLQFPVERAQPVSLGVADDWLYAVSGDAASIVDAAESGGLTDNPRFAALQSGLGEDRVNVFVDVRGIRDLSTDLLSGRDRQMYESQVRPLVSPITFFGGGGRSEPNGDFHGHFLLGISG